MVPRKLNDLRAYCMGIEEEWIWVWAAFLWFLEARVVMEYSKAFAWCVCVWLSTERYSWYPVLVCEYWTCCSMCWCLRNDQELHHSLSPLTQFGFVFPEECATLSLKLGLYPMLLYFGSVLPTQLSYLHPRSLIFSDLWHHDVDVGWSLCIVHKVLEDLS